MKYKVLILCLLASCSVSKPHLDTVGSTRNDTIYPVKKFGTAWWMTENLAYRVVGDSSVTAYPAAQQTGLLYGFASAKKEWPNGWRLPSKEEWLELAEQFSGVKNTREGRVITKKDAADSTSLNIRMQGFCVGKERHVAFTRMMIFWTATDTVFHNKEKLEWNGKRYIGCHFYEASSDSLHAEPTYGKDSPNGYYCRCVRNQGADLN